MLNYLVHYAPCYMLLSSHHYAFPNEYEAGRFSMSFNPNTSILIMRSSVYLYRYNTTILKKTTEKKKIEEQIGRAHV